MANPKGTKASISMIVEKLPIWLYEEFNEKRKSMADRDFTRAEYLEIVYNKSVEYDKMRADKENLLNRITASNKALCAENKREKAVKREYQDKYETLKQTLIDLGRWPVKG